MGEPKLTLSTAWYALTHGHGRSPADIAILAMLVVALIGCGVLFAFFREGSEP